jgi:hypothetical protein
VEDGLQIPKTVRLRAAPEHPRDPETGQPLTFALLSEWELRATLPATGLSRTYKTPKPSLPMVAPIAAILSEEYRSDQATAAVAQSPTGVAILQCPSCGGTLRTEPGRRAVDCPFCRTRCRIPERLRYVTSSHNVFTEPWWILFFGPSKMRQSLEAGEELEAEATDTENASDKELVRGVSKIEGLSATDIQLNWVMTLVVCVVAWLLCRAYGLELIN